VTVPGGIYQYAMPTHVIFGPGAISHASKVAGNEDSRVLVVCSPSMRRLRIADRIMDDIGHGRAVLFDGAIPYPTPDLVDHVVEICQNGRCDVVVAVGGGSTLDLGKSVAALAPTTGRTIDYLAGDASLEAPGLPYVAVPTTAGTGSEVTPWATIWDKDARRKHSLEHQTMFPSHAIVDPELTMSLSPAMTATSGIDALTQAVEAYWSKRSQPISDLYALGAISRIMSNLEDAHKNGQPEARTAMAEGSLMSGLAFSNTKTTICHSLSYPMTALFGVSHGQAVSITLPAFLLSNAHAIRAKVPRLLEALGAGSIEDAASRIRALMTSVGLAVRLNDLGIGDREIETILDQGFYADRADNNPKPVTIQDAREILRGIR
jgi:phosphonate metabolism-associated iron-containing alcohol dehydrogenase